MKIKLRSSQYHVLSRYAEDISKAVALYDVAGYFLPSIVSSTAQPTLFQLVGGAFVALTGLIVALILEGKAGRSK